MSEQPPTQPPATPPPSTPPQRDTVEQAKMIGAIAASVLLAIFFLQNMQRVEVHVLWFDWNTRMILALILSAVLGGVGVFLAMLIGRRQSRRERKGGD